MALARRPSSTAASSRVGAARSGRRGMTLGCAVGIALHSLGRNWTRTFLATLGIIIGVGCVIAMLGLAKGTALQMEERIRNLGSNTVTVRNAARRVGAINLGQESGNALVLEDVEAILAECPSVQRAAPDIDEDMRVEYRNRNDRTEVFGTTNDLFPIRNFKIATGRGFLLNEIRSRARVCLLGAQVQAELFGEADPIGETVQINRQPFLVIGCMRPHGGSDTDWDERVFVPITTFLYRLTGNSRGEIEAVDVQAVDEARLIAAQAEMERVLRNRHRLGSEDENDFNFRNQQDALDSAAQTGAVLTALLAGLASVSLLVGGIGIMNIMLVSVTERTREIGIRRAIGARKRDILVQFLIESLVMCAMGALLGIGAGLAACWAGAVYAAWPAAVTLDSLILSSACAVGTGLFFGLYPAVRAAGLSPLTALRYD
jgi:putative ABC transport system permease protein